MGGVVGAPGTAQGSCASPESRMHKLTKTKLPCNACEVWVPKGKLLAGSMATLLEQDYFPLGTITHITRKC